MRAQSRWQVGPVLSVLVPAQFFVLMLGLTIVVSGPMSPVVARTVATADRAVQARLHIWTDAKGVPQTGPQNQTLSHNWSGYGLSRGGPYTSLPNYGSTTFTAISANNATPKLVLAADGIIMKDPAGNSTSTPSAPSGNSFTVSFGI
jgi:hypothetical protein